MDNNALDISSKVKVLASFSSFLVWFHAASPSPKKTNNLINLVHLLFELYVSELLSVARFAVPNDGHVVYGAVFAKMFVEMVLGEFLGCDDE